MGQHDMVTRYALMFTFSRDATINSLRHDVHSEGDTLLNYLSGVWDTNDIQIYDLSVNYIMMKTSIDYE